MVQSHGAGRNLQAHGRNVTNPKLPRSRSQSSLSPLTWPYMQPITRETFPLPSLPNSTALAHTGHTKARLNRRFSTMHGNPGTAVLERAAEPEERWDLIWGARVFEEGWSLIATPREGTAYLIPPTPNTHLSAISSGQPPSYIIRLQLPYGKQAQKSVLCPKANSSNLQTTKKAGEVESRNKVENQRQPHPGTCMQVIAHLSRPFPPVLT